MSHPSSILRSLLLPLILIASAGAQTAPQLLPYTVKLIAGNGTAAIAAGATCPVSGFTSTDAYGDGCLATEIQLVSPRYATVDSAGNVFFSDYTNGLVRRVDAGTGIVSAVAGGATASPASGAACGAYSATDAHGDGCLSTAVKLSKPAGLAFSPTGDLYFGEIGYGDVRKVAATSGLLPIAGGIITTVAGNNAGTYGYAANNPSGNITSATSYLDSPYDVAFDSSGNLYIAEEYKEAVLVLNTNASTTTTVTGVSIPPGTIAKILGATSGSTPTICPNSPASTNGCSYGLSTFNGQANASEVDSPYAVGVDGAGNVYFADEYYNYAGKISPTGILTDYAGISDAAAKKLQRGPAGSFGIGSDFGIAADSNSNVYITDASSGVIWRVDGAGQSMYVVAGGVTTPCSTAVDAYGDGCPATKAVLGSSGSGLYATSASPGVFGVNVDAYSNLYFGDTITNLIREVASGTQFGSIGEFQAVTQTLEIHFAASDLPAVAAPYTITAGSSTFSVGTATCTTNSDATTDCLLPLTATASALGPFSGTLQVTSSLGAVASFPLSGIAVMSPITRTSVAVASTSTCTGSTVFPTPATLTLTASVVSSGSPTGTVTFYANGAQIGTPQTVSKSTATLSYTFTTANTFAITAIYSGDSYYHTSTSPSTVSIVTSTPTFTASSITNQQNTVAPGQTGLYSFNLAQNVYTGTITLACSGLPSYSSCMFSPATITSTGCSTVSTIAMSVLTQQGAVHSSGAGLAVGGRGWWPVLDMVSGFGLALLIGVRRRNSSLRFGQLWMILALLVGTSGMVACSGQLEGGPATPAGNYTITVTATGSTGATSTFTVPLTVSN